MSSPSSSHSFAPYLNVQNAVVCNHCVGRPPQRFVDNLETDLLLVDSRLEGLLDELILAYSVNLEAVQEIMKVREGCVTEKFLPMRGRASFLELGEVVLKIGVALDRRDFEKGGDMRLNFANFGVVVLLY